jgi:hypothetical protein
MTGQGQAFLPLAFTPVVSTAGSLEASGLWRALCFLKGDFGKPPFPRILSPPWGRSSEMLPLSASVPPFSPTSLPHTEGRWAACPLCGAFCGSPELHKAVPTAGLTGESPKTHVAPPILPACLPPHTADEVRPQPRTWLLKVTHCGTWAFSLQHPCP